LHSDRETAFALGADRYTTKPDNFQNFVDAVKRVCIGCGVCPDAPYPSSR
jgi:hypothetical protein